MLANDHWLRAVEEAILQPELAIVDAHHHLWRHAPPGDYLIDQYEADSGQGHNIVGSVFVECGTEYRSAGPANLRCVGETEFAADQANQSKQPQIKAIVSFADLTLGAAVEDVVLAHIEAGQGLFRGVRHAVAWDADQGIKNAHSNPVQNLLSDPRFGEGVATLGRLDLSFDTWLYHPQIPELTQLARTYPEVTIVLNHLGGPLGVGSYATRESTYQNWQRDIVDLATCANVVVKLGGLAMPIIGFDWHNQPAPPSSSDLVAANALYYHHVIEQFGPDRCMFESNFPVERQSVSYNVLWNAFKRMAEHYSHSERKSLFHDTAKRVYRLEGLQ